VADIPSRLSPTQPQEETDLHLVASSRKIKLYLHSPMSSWDSKKVKLSLQQAVEAHGVVRYRGSHILTDDG
jgi:hypothetical protein